MKSYILRTYLLSLLLITVQASEQNLNTDNQLQQEDLEKWEKEEHLNFQELEEPLKKLYENGIEKTLPVYFVYGPSGSGKSTLIYALQGNEIKKKEKIEIKREREKRKSNRFLGLSNNKISTGELKLEKTVNVPIPEVSKNQHQQESVKIYYTGKKIKESMAFCDTEDYVILEEDFTPSRYSINLKEDKDIIRAYAPYFTLKSNKIHGIVFVTSEALMDNIAQVNKHVNYLLEHFKEDVLSKNKETLKKSIILVINRIQESDKQAFDKLDKLTLNSIEAYNNRFNLRDNYSHLNSFLDLFFKDDDDEIDLEHVHCFHPYDPKNVQQLRKKLANLKPIDPKLFKYKQPKDLVNQYKPKPKPSPKQKSPSPVIYQTSTQETNVEREQQQDEVSIQPGQQDNLNNPSQQQQNTQQDIDGNQSEDDSNNLSDTQEEEHNSTTIPKPPLPDIDQNNDLYKNLGIAGVLAISTVGLLYLMNKNSSTKQKKAKKVAIYLPIR